MRLSIEDLNAFGKARLEDDFREVERRDGGKTSRTDFGLGWMAAMVRIKQWSYFDPHLKELVQLGCTQVFDGQGGWHWEHSDACSRKTAGVA